MAGRMGVIPTGEGLVGRHRTARPATARQFGGVPDWPADCGDRRPDRCPQAWLVVDSVQSDDHVGHTVARPATRMHRYRSRRLVRMTLWCEKTTN